MAIATVMFVGLIIAHVTSNHRGDVSIITPQQHNTAPRIIITTPQRSGSHFVLSLLKSGLGIEGEGEVKSKNFDQKQRENTAVILHENNLYPEKDHNHGHIVLKGNRIIEYILANDDVLVLHGRRSALMKISDSSLAAASDQVYGSHVSKPRKEGAFNLDGAAFHAAMANLTQSNRLRPTKLLAESIRTMEAEEDAFLRSLADLGLQRAGRLLVYDYEDLILDHREAHLAVIFEFILRSNYTANQAVASAIKAFAEGSDATPESLETNLLHPPTCSSRVENYDRLAALISGTRTIEKCTRLEEYFRSLQLSSRDGHKGSSMLPVAPRNPRSFLALRTRTGTHSGSDWFATLLLSVKINMYFQFSGWCSSGMIKGGYYKDPETSEANNTDEKLRSLLKNGCRCKHQKSLEQQKGRYCEGNCNDSCDNPVVVMPKSGEEWLVAKNEIVENGVPFITWERENSVKHAFSQMKAKCHTAALANHFDNTSTKHYMDLKSQPITLALLNFKQLLSRAVSNSNSRRELSSMSNISYAGKYEYFQLDEHQGMYDLLAATGLGKPKRAASSGSNMMKVIKEDLSTVILGFSDINASFSTWPCLQRMLSSPIVERFSSACQEHELPQPHQIEDLNINNAELFSVVSKYEEETVVQCRSADGLMVEMKNDDETLVCRHALQQGMLVGDSRTSTMTVDVCIIP